MASQMHRMMRNAPVILLLVLLAGCVTRSNDLQTVHIRYEYWVPLLAFAVGALAIIAGLAMTSRFRWGPLLGGLVCIGLVGPTSALTGVWVTDDEFIVHSGIWGMTAKAHIRFDDISGARDVTKKALGVRGQITYRPNLRLKLADGHTVDVPISNDVMLEARKEIFERMTTRQ